MPTCQCVRKHGTAAVCLLEHGQNSQISDKTAARLLPGSPVSNDHMDGGAKPEAGSEVAV